MPSECEGIEPVAGAVSGIAHRTVDFSKSEFPVQVLRRRHALQRFEVTGGVSALAGGFQAVLEHRCAQSVSPCFGQEVHLFEFADLVGTVRQLIDPRAADDGARGVLHDEEARPFAGVVSRMVTKRGLDSDERGAPDALFI